MLNRRAAIKLPVSIERSGTPRALIVRFSAPITDAAPVPGSGIRKTRSLSPCDRTCAYPVLYSVAPARGGRKLFSSLSVPPLCRFRPPR